MAQCSVVGWVEVREGGGGVVGVARDRTRKFVLVWVGSGPVGNGRGFA